MDTGLCDPCGLNFYRDVDLHNTCQQCGTGLITLTDTAGSDAECLRKYTYLQEYLKLKFDFSKYSLIQMNLGHTGFRS